MLVNRIPGKNMAKLASLVRSCISFRFSGLRCHAASSCAGMKRKVMGSYDPTKEVRKSQAYCGLPHVVSGRLVRGDNVFCHVTSLLDGDGSVRDGTKLNIHLSLLLPGLSLSLICAS